MLEDDFEGRDSFEIWDTWGTFGYVTLVGLAYTWHGTLSFQTILRLHSLLYSLRIWVESPLNQFCLGIGGLELFLSFWLVNNWTWFWEPEGEAPSFSLCPRSSSGSFQCKVEVLSHICSSLSLVGHSGTDGPLGLLGPCLVEDWTKLDLLGFLRRWHSAYVQPMHEEEAKRFQ